MQLSVFEVLEVFAVFSSGTLPLTGAPVVLYGARESR